LLLLSLSLSLSLSLPLSLSLAPWLWLWLSLRLSRSRALSLSLCVCVRVGCAWTACLLGAEHGGGGVAGLLLLLLHHHRGVQVELLQELRVRGQSSSSLSSSDEEGDEDDELTRGRSRPGSQVPRRAAPPSLPSSQPASAPHPLWLAVALRHASTAGWCLCVAVAAVAGVRDDHDKNGSSG
jgi:hypothetical protein